MAATIITLVLLSLLGTISFALEGSRQAEGQQEAAWHAQALFENIRERGLPSSLGFNDPAGARIPLNDPPVDIDLPADTGYTRRIVTQRLATDPSDYQSKIYRVDVTVFWKSKRRESSFSLNGLYYEP